LKADRVALKDAVAVAVTTASAEEKEAAAASAAAAKGTACLLLGRAMLLGKNCM